MALNRRSFDATPQEVFDALLDARQYPNWVVGAKEIRAVDPEWPAVGSAFHHEVGAGDAVVQDKSAILELDVPHRIALRTFVRPLGIARVEITARAEAGGSIVTIFEEPERGTRLHKIARVVDPLIHIRNIESLRRLERLVRSLKNRTEIEKGTAPAGNL